jgi:hypothetical protein
MARSTFDKEIRPSEFKELVISSPVFLVFVWTNDFNSALASSRLPVRISTANSEEEEPATTFSGVNLIWDVEQPTAVAIAD